MAEDMEANDPRLVWRPHPHDLHIEVRACAYCRGVGHHLMSCYVDWPVVRPKKIDVIDPRAKR